MMDAPTFGAFLAETRRARGLTQRDLAERLHVTDKAVSRWERGVGLPDINTLEPLADALGLTLSQLMHADHGGAAAQPAQTLAEFFALMTPAQIAWADVRRAIFWLTIGLAVWAQCTLPWQVAIHWHWADGAWLVGVPGLYRPVRHAAVVLAGVAAQCHGRGGPGVAAGFPPAAGRGRAACLADVLDGLGAGPGAVCGDDLAVELRHGVWPKCVCEYPRIQTAPALKTVPGLFMPS